MLLVAAPVAAQDGPYASYLVGERSLGLAGAFVAVADDALTTFHNPAGIGNLRSAALSGSLWAVTLAYHTVNDGYVTDLGRKTLAHSEEPGLPMNIAAVFKFGKRDADGVRPHAMGASVVSPLRLDYRFTGQLEGTRDASGADAVDHLEVRRRDRARWYGASYSYRLKPGFSLGVSAFLTDRDFRHEEVELRATDPSPDGTTPGSSDSRTSLVEATAQHGVLRLGALWRVNRHWQLGMMFQPPAVRFDFGSRVQSVHTVNGGMGFESYSERDAPVNLPMPWELRAGASWLAVPNRLITLDLSLLGPSGSAGDPQPLVLQDPGDPSPGAFVPQRTQRLASVRGALGYEIIVNNIMPIRGGFMFETGANPAIPATSDLYLSDDLNSVGVALSFGVWTEGYEISFGTTAVFRRGDGLGLVRSDDPTVPEYARRDVRDGAIFFFVAGGSRAVQTLVKRIASEGEPGAPSPEATPGASTEPR
jgi:hypothetical protein